MSAQRPGTLTQRVVWALTGTVAVFVAALALLAYLTFDQMEDDLVDEIVTTETERLVHQVRAGDDLFKHEGGHELGGPMKAWLVTGGHVPADMPPAFHGLGNGMHLIQLQHYVWHVMVTDARQGRLYVLYDATENEGRVYDFGLIVLGIGAICIVAAYALSRRIAALAVGPLLELTDRLSTWAPGAPDLAVQRDDEAGRLVEAFNRVQNQVDRSIAREREFAANLSHEVRTPLAAIRSDCELMLLTQALTEDQRLRLTRVVNNVDSVTAALKSARALARDQRRRPEFVSLADCMEDAWRGLEANAEAAGLSLRNTIPGNEVRLLDRYALLTVLRNLVLNAIEHAAPAELTVTAGPEGLELRDNGKGIAPSDLPFVFQRYYHGRMHDTDGPDASADAMPRGLGLAIAKRVCDLQGWSLSVSSVCEAPGRGTGFVLCFDGESPEGSCQLLS